ncbi:MAG: ribosome-associated protein [Limisphaerales bacterium]|jgi:ribosome-associated protein
MQKQTFQLSPPHEFIELISLLKSEGIAQTGGHAKIMVGEGEVKVNGEIELKKRCKLRVGDLIEVEDINIVIIATPDNKAL